MRGTNIAAEVAQFKRDIAGMSAEEIKRFHQIEIHSDGSIWDFVTETEYANLTKWIIESNADCDDPYDDDYGIGDHNDEEF